MCMLMRYKKNTLLIILYFEVSLMMSHNNHFTTKVNCIVELLLLDTSMCIFWTAMQLDFELYVHVHIKALKNYC